MCRVYTFLIRFHRPRHQKKQVILPTYHHTGYNDFAYPAIYQYIKEYLLLCLFAFSSKNKQYQIKVHDKKKNNVTHNFCLGRLRYKTLSNVIDIVLLTLRGAFSSNNKQGQIKAHDKKKNNMTHKFCLERLRYKTLSNVIDIVLRTLRIA